MRTGAPEDAARPRHAQFPCPGAGEPAGYIIELEIGYKNYRAGDTGVFGLEDLSTGVAAAQ